MQKSMVKSLYNQKAPTDCRELHTWGRAEGKRGGRCAVIGQRGSVGHNGGRGHAGRFDDLQVERGQASAGGQA